MGIERQGGLYPVPPRGVARRMAYPPGASWPSLQLLGAHGSERPRPAEATRTQGAHRPGLAEADNMESVQAVQAAIRAHYPSTAPSATQCLRPGRARSLAESLISRADEKLIRAQGAPSRCAACNLSY